MLGSGPCQSKDDQAEILYQAAREPGQSHILFQIARSGHMLRSVNCPTVTLRAATKPTIVEETIIADEKIEKLRNRAYQIWQSKGRPLGRDP